MDYKLEALHKQYWARLIIGVGTFLLSFIGMIVFLILVLSFGTNILKLITFLCLFIEFVTVVAMIANWVTPKWLEQAEKEYQTIKKDEKQRSLKAKEDSAMWAKWAVDFYKRYERQLDQLCDGYDSQKQFIARLVENVGVLEWVARNYEGLSKLLSEKPSTLDKKLEPKKPYKITIDEFINSKQKLAIRVHTEEEAQKVVKALNKERQHKWESNYWDIYKEVTSYSNKDGYCYESWYIDDGYTIYDFSEVCFEPKKKGGK